MHKTQLSDVLLWLCLALMWGSSFAVIKVGVATLDPRVLVVGRMLIGTIVMYLALKLRGQSLSPSLTVWGTYAVTGLLGSGFPFLLITYGERTVDSALASILMGLVPVVTMLLAAWLVPSERLTARTVIGILGGLIGVAVLVGPVALRGLGDQLGGQLSILGATACYASSTVFIRRFVTRPPLEMAAGSLIVGTAFIAGVSALSGADFTGVKAAPEAWGAVLYLGLFSTAAANLIYFHLVPRLGATRMSQVNFVVPVTGLVIGTVLLGEALTPQRLLALMIIMGSVYLGTSARRPRKATA